MCGRMTTRDGVVGPFEPCEPVRKDWIRRDHYVKLPHYSTCPTACEDVKAEIRRMVATGRYECKMTYMRLSSGDVRTYVEIFDCENGPVYCRHSMSEYEAVCRAFVAAVGREKE